MVFGLPAKQVYSMSIEGSSPSSNAICRRWKVAILSSLENCDAEMHCGFDAHFRRQIK